jgi:hypothetical protein
MKYTAVTWRVITQIIADVLSVWSTAQTARQLSPSHIIIKILGRNVYYKIKKSCLPSLNATYSVIRCRNMDNRKQQADKILAVGMDFWRISTRNTNCLNNTTTATNDVGKTIFETPE